MPRNRFRALSEEVEKEAGILDAFSRSKVQKAKEGSVFAGAGDSYAAALAAFYASWGRCIALDPYTLASAPKVAEGADVYLVSVSGRTSSNIAAAKKIRGKAARVIAITADDRSRLAELADEVVRLPMEYAPRTPGLLSFSLSLLAVLKSAGVEGRCDFAALGADARKDVGKVAWGKGVNYFLGNSLGHVAALYAAAKTYEFLGARAHPELLEEFSHMQLFSLAKSDMVNIFSCSDPLGAARRLWKALRDEGYEASLVGGNSGSAVAELFYSVFVIQLSAIKKARESGLSEPGFLGDARRLRVSDRMIY